MTSRADKRQRFLDALIATGQSEVTLSELKDVAADAGLAIPYWFINSKIIELNGGCGNDGLTYCSMALGNIEFAPFSRRTFCHWIAILFSITNFQIAS